MLAETEEALRDVVSLCRLSASFQWAKREK